MAFSITNKNFGDQPSTWLPQAHKELADQTATTSAVDTGVAGLRWARVRIWVKTLGTFAAADTYRFTLQVGTGSAITGPVDLVSYASTAETGMTLLAADMLGAHPLLTGFQSWKLIVTIGSSHSLTFDVLFDAA